jgi:hypothetical protein
MANFFYIKPEVKTQEQVQQEIDALTHTEFMLRLASYLGHIGCTGASPYYYGGVLTPMGMMVRAMCNRLSRINGDVRLTAIYKQDFENRDALMKKEAEEAKPWSPPVPNTYWIDSEAMKKASEELSTTQALLTTYPISGCVPLRTLTPEEMKSLDTIEL